jgi:hypothetical protein
MRPFTRLLVWLGWRWHIPRFENDPWRHVPNPDPLTVIRRRVQW